MQNTSTREHIALSKLRQIIHGPGELLRANWVKMQHTCGKSSCRCSKAKRHWHLSWYVSQSKNGKQRMKCVPREQLDEVRRWVSRYQEARELLTVVGDAYWDRIGKSRK
jgi:hypothetical protein